MERRRLCAERVERLRDDRVEEKFWALEGNWRSEMEVGKVSGQVSSAPLGTVVMETRFSEVLVVIPGRSSFGAMS